MKEFDAKFSACVKLFQAEINRKVVTTRRYSMEMRTKFDKPTATA